MPHSRYIELPSGYPHDSEGWTSMYSDIRKALIKSLRQVEREAQSGSISSRDSVYVGNCGVAFMQYRLSELHLVSSNSKSPPNSRGSLNPDALRIKADELLHSIIRQNRLPTVVKDTYHISFLETHVGPAVLLLGRCLESLSHARYSENENALGNLRKHWKSAVYLISGILQRIPSEDGDKSWMDEDGCEVLYGRAGFLYGLLYLRKALKKAMELKSYKELESSQREEIESITSDHYMGVVVESLVARGKLGVRYYTDDFASGTISELPPLMWRWHGRRYLGGAHGVAGILQMLLSCPRSLLQNHISDILSTVEWLVGLQDADGNWPSKAPEEASREEVNELVQWCHGAPGVVILLSTVLRLDAQENGFFKLSDDLKTRFVSSLKRGADFVYERGLIRKGVGLCHGVGGSVFTLLSASSVLDTPGKSESYLKKAIHLAHLATFVDEFVDKGQMTVPDRPWSLYEGMAGMCCAWGEIIHRLGDEKRRSDSVPSHMPGYDDIE